MSKNQDQARAIFDALLHDADLLDTERGEGHHEEALWAERLAESERAQVAALRRARVTQLAGPVKAPSRIEILPWLRTLTRGELVARLQAALTSPDLQLAYRNVGELTDDDLRLTLTTLERDAETPESKP